MTEKDIKKLNRYQLLELLLIQTERANALEAEVKKLQAQQIQLSNLGSMAEAAVQLSGVLEAAEQAAQLYLEAAKAQAQAILAEASKTASE